MNTVATRIVIAITVGGIIHAALYATIYSNKIDEQHRTKIIDIRCGTTYETVFFSSTL